MASTAVREVEQSKQQVHLFSAWKDDVVNVKKLYLNRKYRPCAVLCAELLLEARHPLHRTFLYFYQAICYESLGQFAHNYSTNKIPLLEQAKDSFLQALQALPLPFITAEDGDHLSPGLSPGCPTLDILPHYCSPVPDPKTPQPAPKPNQRLRSTTISSTYSTNSSSNDKCPTPRFDDYSPRQLFGTNPTTPTPRPTQLHPPELPTSTEKRLSESLSHNHILAEDLVPSPLFSRKLTSKKAAQTPDTHPLPPLPFNHAPRFQVLGQRCVLQPRRKTALSTLISRFEGTLPDPESSPLTPRFERISKAFEPRLDPAHIDLDVQPQTDTQTDLSSHALTRYNNTLTSFRTQLDNHVTTINAKISAATLAQQAHAAKKPARLASFWSFKPADMREQDGKRERIEKLKREGWVVNKEVVGWKGQAHYDDLRRRATLDLV